jgi:superfamily II DNA or RNA helicase
MEIFEQLVELHKSLFGEDAVGIVGKIGKKSYHKIGQITIGMYKTVLNRLSSGEAELTSFCKEITLLQVDEAHRCSSAEYQKLIGMFNANVVVGYSGTIFGASDNVAKFKILGSFGGVLAETNNDDMVQGGYSLKPVVHIMYGDDYPQYSNYELADSAIMFSAERIESIVTYCKRYYENRVIMIVCKHNPIKHCEHIFTELAKQGLPVKMLHGQVKNRKELTDALRKGEVKILVTNILQEGFNGGIDTLIYARGGKAEIALVQYIGRILRKEGNVETPHIIDFEDMCKKYLHKHYKKRVEIYKNYNFTILKNLPNE